MVEVDEKEKLYFVVESKGSDLALDIKESESGKIKCAIEHFRVISHEVNMLYSKDFEGFKENYPLTPHH